MAGRCVVGSLQGNTLPGKQYFTGRQVADSQSRKPWLPDRCGVGSRQASTLHVCRFTGGYPPKFLHTCDVPGAVLPVRQAAGRQASTLHVCRFTGGYPPKFLHTCDVPGAVLLAGSQSRKT